MYRSCSFDHKDFVIFNNILHSSLVVCIQPDYSKQEVRSIAAMRKAISDIAEAPFGEVRILDIYHYSCLF